MFIGLYLSCLINSIYCFYRKWTIWANGVMFVVDPFTVKLPFQRVRVPEGHLYLTLSFPLCVSITRTSSSTTVAVAQPGWPIRSLLKDFRGTTSCHWAEPCRTCPPSTRSPAGPHSLTEMVHSRNYYNWLKMQTYFEKICFLCSGNIK